MLGRLRPRLLLHRTGEVPECVCGMGIIIVQRSLRPLPIVAYVVSVMPECLDTIGALGFIEPAPIEYQSGRLNPRLNRGDRENLAIKASIPRLLLYRPV